MITKFFTDLPLFTPLFHDGSAQSIVTHRVLYDLKNKIKLERWRKCYVDMFPKLNFFQYRIPPYVS